MILLQQQLADRPVVNKPVVTLLDQLMAWKALYVGIPYQWDGHGNPGFDCSEWVRLIYQEIFKISVPGFTDAIFWDEDLEALYPQDARLGDIVLYQYHDPGQPGVMFPHTGIWINDRLVLDSRYPDGVNLHYHLNNTRMVIMRKKGN